MKVAFMFTGRGSENLSMGKHLYEEDDVFLSHMGQVQQDLQVN